LPVTTTRGIDTPSLTGDGADVPQWMRSMALDIEAILDNPLSLSSSLAVASGAVVNGLTVPSAGAGVEVGYTAGVGFVQAQQRGPDAAKPLAVAGSQVRVQAAGVQVATATSTGVDFPLGFSGTDGAYRELGYSGGGQSTNAFQTGASTWDISTLSTAAGVASRGLRFDPAAFAVTNRTVVLRLVFSVATNQVAPANTMTLGLYPVNFTAGVSGSANTYALGTVVTGSTVAVATPTASTRQAVVSADFTAPSAGWYTLGVAFSGAPAANARTDLDARIQQRLT
jgi:hypothetical protein